MTRYKIRLVADLNKDTFFIEIRDGQGLVGELYEQGDELIIELATYGQNHIKEPLEEFIEALRRSKERLFIECSEGELDQNHRKRKYSVIIMSLIDTESVNAEILDDQRQVVAGVILEDGHRMLKMYSSESGYMSVIIFNYYGFMEALEQAQKICGRHL